MLKHYKVCVYAICKNEEKFVERWMDSMSEADFIIVTDTGSTDHTVKRLLERGAIVHIENIRPWRFDVARNKSLEYVPSDIDICVCTDLDEIFNRGWREKLEELWEPEINQAHYLFNWSHNENGIPGIQFNYFKIHDRKNFVWVYPVHEVLRYKGKQPKKEIFVPGIILDHYPDSTKSRASYLSLLEVGVKENPQDDRMMYYLGREYAYSEKWEKSIEILTCYLQLKSAKWLEERSAAMCLIANNYGKLGKSYKAYRWYYRAIAETPYRREPYIDFAIFAYTLQDWSAVFYLTQTALKIKQKSSTYTNLGYAWDFTPDDLASISCYWLGMYEASLDHAKAALMFEPNNLRLKNNLLMIQEKIDKK